MSTAEDLDALERRVGEKWMTAVAARMPHCDFPDNPFDSTDWLAVASPMPSGVPQFPREQWVSYPDMRTVALLIVDRMLDLDLTDEQWTQVCFVMQYGGKTRVVAQRYRRREDGMKHRWYLFKLLFVRPFWRGFCNTLGIAQVRRRVETPEESMQAVKDELRLCWEAEHRPDCPNYPT